MLFIVVIMCDNFADGVKDANIENLLLHIVVFAFKMFLKRIDESKAEDFLAKFTWVQR
jgi:hypothetical protein